MRPDAALNDLPATYAEVPQLGPPLPGDLGRPILAQRRAEERRDLIGEEEARQSAQRERGLAEQRAAAAAPVLVQRSTQPQSGVAAALEGEKRTAPARVDTGSTSHWLAAGTVVSASLLTGIRSDIPGMVVAQVTSPVRDSATGRVVLVPQGARLIGEYDSVGSFGQRRLGIRWKSMTMPDGASVALGGARATDAAGNAGLTGEVDLQTGMLFKGAAIATLLGVGTELSIGGDGALVGALRRGTQDSMARAGDRLVQRNLDIKPTISVAPGTPVRLLVEADLYLEPWSLQ